MPVRAQRAYTSGGMGTALYTRPQGVAMTYRILSLDGRGPWALIEVRALLAIYKDENKRGREVLSDFDMVVANSAGSIVLGGLLEDMTLSELLACFENREKRE